MTEHALLRNEAMAALARYELQFCARQPFGTLSGGQQARLQILLLELAGSTLLLLDEPTDNLDLASAEALQEGLESYQGTVLAVTHDRWFARSFDRFLVFGADGNVYEARRPGLGRDSRGPAAVTGALLGCRGLQPDVRGGRAPAGDVKGPHSEEAAPARPGRAWRFRRLAEGPGRSRRARLVDGSHHKRRLTPQATAPRQRTGVIR